MFIVVISDILYAYCAALLSVVNIMYLRNGVGYQYYSNDLLDDNDISPFLQTSW